MKTENIPVLLFAVLMLIAIINKVSKPAPQLPIDRIQTTKN